MKLKIISGKAALVSAILVSLLFSSCVSISENNINQADYSNNGKETIVIVRHGEKPKKGLGQLNIAGLKRSLLLPDFFKKNFHNANYIFAPNPADKHFAYHGDKKWHCYVRPLATIEPTAITLGLPVDTTFGLKNTEQLVNKILQPKYHDSTIYIAWEHSRILDIAKELIDKMHASNISIPDWEEDNYNMVFVFNIDWSKSEGKKLSFKVMSENFNNLNDKKVAPSYLNKLNKDQ